MKKGFLLADEDWTISNAMAPSAPSASKEERIAISVYTKYMFGGNIPVSYTHL